MTIKQARKKAKLTQGKLATAIGKSRSQYQNIEKGNIDLVKLGVLKKIAEACNIKLEDLL